ncbi:MULTISPECIES: hypothetical protein [Aequorivita]|uniref:Uncharacterized protein n=2 Tax=Aequorivita TaxID=153265 RepID=A0AB35YWI9_9FLAO|nr:hypothetical protein [Aequorivita sp. Ant34-E75]WGF92668.1 hypothetical protein QCQ61_00410 [Aequorivita sp. Ant34-E75]
MVLEIIERIKKNASGESEDCININGVAFQLHCKWRKRVFISISPKQPTLIETTVSTIKKAPLMSIIVRTPQYRIQGARTKTTENLLANKFTPALLHYPFSELRCINKNIAFTATLKKKHIIQLEKMVLYFEALLRTVK